MMLSIISNKVNYDAIENGMDVSSYDQFTPGEMSLSQGELLRSLPGNVPELF